MGPHLPRCARNDYAQYFRGKINIYNMKIHRQMITIFFFLSSVSVCLLLRQPGARACARVCVFDACVCLLRNMRDVRAQRIAPAVVRREWRAGVVARDVRCRSLSNVGGGGVGDGTGMRVELRQSSAGLRMWIMQEHAHEFDVGYCL